MQYKQLIKKILYCIPDGIYLRLLYLYRLKKKLNLNKPKRFTEKLQWLKIYDRNPLYTILVDKYAVKEYVANKIGENYVIPTIGIWDDFDDISFNELPDQFVLKCTHDSGGNVIVRDKRELNVQEARKKINYSLKNNFFFNGREWPYKNVPHKVIAEKYMEDPLVKEIVDYKFYCFNGEPNFLYISQGLENHKTARISFVTLSWTPSKYQRSDYPIFEVLPDKPTRFDEMVEIAKKLSKGIPFVRVDLYEISGQIFFSEMTFFPCGGFMPFKNIEHDYEIGELLNLPRL